MSVGEFEIIENIFAASPPGRTDVLVGPGDDCAVLAVPPDCRLVVSVDTMVAGVHFPTTMTAERVGHRALATSLSDLAAMGAEPAWVTLALTVPSADTRWLSAFNRGFRALASAHNVDLVGGDLTRGPLTISVQVHGFVPDSGGLKRADARPGQRVVVTGTLGDAAGALACSSRSRDAAEPDRSYLLRRLERPVPRIEFGRSLLGYATAAIDLSDGLLQDLGHILRHSRVGAVVDVRRVPRSQVLRRVFGDAESLRLALTGGDDYELCFTCETDALATLREANRGSGLALTDIGVITEEPGLRVEGGDMESAVEREGFSHF